MSRSTFLSRIFSVAATSGAEQLDSPEAERGFDAPEIERKVAVPDSNRKLLEEIKRHALAHVSFARPRNFCLLAHHRANPASSSPALNQPDRRLRSSDWYQSLLIS